MNIKVFTTNASGKIEFTRCELEKLLSETYREGYNDGETQVKKSLWTSPDITLNSPYCDTTIVPSNTAKVDFCSGVDNKASETTKIATSEAPAKTYNSKDITYNLDDLVATVEALLNDKSIFNIDLYAHPNLNGAKKAIEDNTFTNLAKELRSL